MPAALLLAACASTPLVPLNSREAAGRFAVDARFALRLAPPGEAVQSSGGRLSWQHDERGERILVANPLGVGLAEISSDSHGARLKAGNGEVREAATADELFASITGRPLPVGKLAGWLTGRSATATISRDFLGRPQDLREDGWQVSYSYDDEAADALPARLEIRQGDELELRLRIESWSELP